MKYTLYTSVIFYLTIYLLFCIHLSHQAARLTKNDLILQRQLYARILTKKRNLFTFCTKRDEHELDIL